MGGWEFSGWEFIRVGIFRVAIFRVGVYQVGVFWVGVYRVGVFQVGIFRTPRKITHSVKEIQTDILNSHIFHICKNLLIPTMFLAVSRTVLCRHMMSSLYVPWLFTKVSETSATYLTSHLLKHATRFIVEKYLKVHFGANKRSLNIFFYCHRVHYYINFIFSQSCIFDVSAPLKNKK